MVSKYVFCSLFIKLPNILNSLEYFRHAYVFLTFIWKLKVNFCLLYVIEHQKCLGYFHVTLFVFKQVVRYLHNKVRPQKKSRMYPKTINSSSSFCAIEWSKYIFLDLSFSFNLIISCWSHN